MKFLKCAVFLTLFCNSITGNHYVRVLDVNSATPRDVNQYTNIVDIVRRLPPEVLNNQNILHNPHNIGTPVIVNNESDSKENRKQRGPLRKRQRKRKQRRHKTNTSESCVKTCYSKVRLSCKKKGQCKMKVYEELKGACTVLCTNGVYFRRLGFL